MKYLQAKEDEKTHNTIYVQFPLLHSVVHGMQEEDFR
jgi:hypothetical protein